MKWCFWIGEMKKEHSKVKEIVEILLVESEEIKLTRLKKRRKFDKHAMLYSIIDEWYLFPCQREVIGGSNQMQTSTKIETFHHNMKVSVISHLYNYGHFLLLVFVVCNES